MLRTLITTTRSRWRLRYEVLNQIEVSRQRLLHNVRLLQAQHPGLSIIPVLKANAYGHGLEEVTTILNDAKIDMLAVDGYFEAAAIRRLTRHKILVMGYILPANVRLLDTRRCSFVVQDLAGLEAFGRLKKRVRIHLELNTGMNRLGLNPTELDGYVTALKRFPKLELEGVMSHLADADNPLDDAFTSWQVREFEAGVTKILAAGFRPKLIHLAQTAGSTKVQSTLTNGLRLGIGLYGLNPLAAADHQHDSLSALQPVLRLTSTIIKVIDLKKGDKVSYNGIFTATKPLRIAVLPLGYYEGVPRALSNRGTVSYQGSQLPIVGRVCMNHTMIDISGTNLKVGDKVVVIGDDAAMQNSFAGWQSRHGLFIYESMAALAPSVRRVVV